MVIVQAKTTLEAVDYLARGYKPAAGFTNIYVNLKKGKLDEEKAAFVDLSGIQRLREIKEYDSTLCIGGAAVMQDIADYLMYDYTGEFAALGMAAGSVGGPQTRNRATIGGNMADASPSADTVPALMVLGAKIELMSARGLRVVDVNDFFTGYRQTVMEPDELIHSILLYRKGGRSIFQKVGKRSALAIGVAGMAVRMKETDGIISEAQIAMSSVGPTAMRLKAAENLIVGEKADLELFREAANTVEQDIAPIDDIRATAEYRKTVAENLLVSCLKQVTEAKI